MACEQLEPTASSVELRKLTPTPVDRETYNPETFERQPKYELDFGVEVPDGATRAVFTYKGNEYIIYFGCAVASSVDGLQLLEMPVGWNEDILPCGEVLDVEVVFFDCDTDPCCDGGPIIEMPDESTFNTPEFGVGESDLELIRGGSVLISA